MAKKRLDAQTFDLKPLEDQRSGLQKSGWKVSGEYSVPKQLGEAKRIANEIRTELKRTGYEPRPVSTTQAASTQANLDRQAKGLPRDWDAPLEGWKADEKAYDEWHKDPTNKDKEKAALGTRDISLDEFHVEQRVRENRGRDHSIGTDPKAIGTTPEKKESAIHHFTVSPPADLTKEDLERAVGLEPIKSQRPNEEIWIKLPWYRAVWHWLRGGKVQSNAKPKTQTLAELMEEAERDQK